MFAQNPSRFESLVSWNYSHLVKVSQGQIILITFSIILNIYKKYDNFLEKVSFFSSEYHEDTNMNVNCFYKIYSAVLTLHIPNWALHMTRLFTNYISEIFRPHSIICLGRIRSVYLLISPADLICLHSCEPFSILENQRIVLTSGRGQLWGPAPNMSS